MSDKIITYEYAAANYDAYKKKTIPSTKKCMTKAEVIEYINVDRDIIHNFPNNKLLPIAKVIGMYPEA